MGYHALLFCSDEKAARAVEKILSELDFAVASCGEPFAAVKKITTEHFDALVVDCHNEQDATLLFKSARNSASNHSSLAVALVEGQGGIAKAFRIGANLVLSKPINVEQSKATLRVARGLLRKAETAKPAPASSPEVPELSAASTAVESPDLPEFPSGTDLSSVSFALLPANTVSPTAPSAAAGLEIEAVEEPTPALGPAEAALIESMPDPLIPQPGADVPISQPAESTSRISPGETPTKPYRASADHQPQETNTHAVGGGSSSGGAAAAAPAKEIPGAIANLFEAPSTPSHSNAEPAAKPTSERKRSVRRSSRASAAAGPHPDLPDQAPETAAEGSDKKNFLVAAVLVIGCAVAGYFAWPQLQPVIMNLGIVRKYVAPQSPPTSQAPPAAAPAPSTATPASASDSSAPQPTADSTPAPVNSAGPQPAPAAAKDQTSAQPSESPAPGAPSSGQAQPLVGSQPDASPAHPSGAVRSVAPVVVKSEAKKHTAAAQIAPPAPLEVASGSQDKAVAGLMSTTGAGNKPVLQVIRVSQGVSNGLLVKRVQPVYPPLAMQMRVEGAVELEATVSKDGSTREIKVVKGDSMLARAAVDAVRKWKYKPYVLNGAPVELQTQITVNFKLPL